MHYIIRAFFIVKTLIIYKPIFKRLGYKAIIKSPLKIDGGKNIIIGENVYIAYKTWLAAKSWTGAEECTLQIANGCVIGNFNHIYATKKIILEENVLTADKVYISDNQHGYSNIEVPIMFQPIVQKNEVRIGKGTWIGENACIIGVTIGKNCVIGANSVVINNVPDYCVVVGSPARIVKRYNFQSNNWQKTDNLGNFIN